MKDLSHITLISGGAKGSDTEWERLAKEHNLKTKIFTTKDYDNIDKGTTFYNEIEEAYKLACKQLDRPEINTGYVSKLVRRDYLQAKNAQAIYAIGNIIKPKEKDSKGYINKTNREIVSGGTGYCVQMAINLNKAVFVFNQKDTKWYLWNNFTYKFVSLKNVIPDLQGISYFAGIGTREITEEGKQTIKDFYQNSINILNKQ